MKHFFQRDGVLPALLAGIGVMLLFSLLLLAGMHLTGQRVEAHLRWFGGAFIPLILVLRAYAKTRRHLVATTTLIVLLFVSFLAFMFLLTSTHSIRA